MQTWTTIRDGVGQEQQPTDSPLSPPDSPWRYVGVTAACGMCGRPLTSVGDKWCSGACRQRAYRRRKQRPSSPLVLPAAPLATDHIIYQCPSCEERYLGLQRCPECQLFCRRIGPGGSCPHCDEPVACLDLLEPLPTAEHSPQNLRLRQNHLTRGVLTR
jgi:hypothetical protein